MKHLASIFVIALNVVGCSAAEYSHGAIPLDSETPKLEYEIPIVKALPPREMVFAGRAGVLTDESRLEGFNSGKFYRVSVDEGQILEIKQINADKSRLIALKVIAPTGDDISYENLSCSNHITVFPTVKGIYLIEAKACSDAAEWTGKYTIRVSAD